MTRNSSGPSLRRFATKDDGNVAMIAALAIVPILTIAGFAVDFQLATTAKSKVQAAIDSAVLAATKSIQEGRSEAEVRTEATNYLNAVLGQGIVGNEDEAADDRGLKCRDLTLTVIDATDEVEAEILCSSATTLSQITGRDKVDFRVSSAATFGIGKLEVAFVFDVSGSMSSNNRMTNLKAAAHEAINTLLPVGGGMGEPGDVRLAMVSYDTMVNAGPYFKDVTNVDPTRTTTATNSEWNSKKTCTGYNKSGKCNKWTGGYDYNNVSYTFTSTCVWERTGADKFTDKDPGPTRWVTPLTATYNDSSNSWSVNSPSSPYCNTDVPVPLTFDRTKLTSFVNSMQPRGMTAGHLGTEWGWYMLSPEWTSVWPAASSPLPYDEPDAVKVAILMTDGAFNQTLPGGTQGDSFAQARAQCDAMKAKGIVIYTVALEAPTAGQQVLSYCATSPANAFTANGGQQLVDAYKVIARSISDLRIAR